MHCVRYVFGDGEVDAMDVPPYRDTLLIKKPSPFPRTTMGP